MTEHSRSSGKQNPASAADAYRGFSLQATRFLVRLLQAPPGSLVSLEVFEDVGVETPDGARIAEQDTSSLAHNPVSDRSPKLWKTFANWLQSVAEGTLDVHRTVFELYVSRPVDGRLVRAFSEASSREQALAAIASARALLTDPELASSLEPFAARILPVNDDIFATLVMNFTLSVGSGDPTHGVSQLMRMMFVPDEITDEVTIYSLGFVKKRLDTLLHADMPAVLPVDDFRIAIGAFVRSHDRRTILASFAGIPAREDIEAHQLRTYIHQLALVDADDDDKVTAIKDFLRASIDRTTWSVKGWVDCGSFSDFEDGLARTWKNLKTQVEIELQGRSCEERGRQLYAKCSTHQSTLEGLQLPSHFVPGSFHALSDDETIGWHPSYKERLLALRQSTKGE